jgi:hypothetical protein
MANIKFANNVRDQIKDAIEKGATPLIDTTQVFPLDKVGYMKKKRKTQIIVWALTWNKAWYSLR